MITAEEARNCEGLSIIQEIDAMIRLASESGARFIEYSTNDIGDRSCQKIYEILIENGFDVSSGCNSRGNFMIVRW